VKIALIVVAVIVALPVLAGILFLGIGRERSWELIAGSADRGRLDLVKIERSPTANDALACTASLRDDCDFALPAFDQTPAQLSQRIAAQIEKSDSLARRVDDGSAPEHLRYVTHSPNMRFPDLVNIEIVPLPDGRYGVLAYARAQLGKLDFGANQNRLERYFHDIR
jgi:hypothetical protein